MYATAAPRPDHVTASVLEGGGTLPLKSDQESFRQLIRELPCGAADGALASRRAADAAFPASGGGAGAMEGIGIGLH